MPSVLIGRDKWLSSQKGSDDHTHEIVSSWQQSLLTKSYISLGPKSKDQIKLSSRNFLEGLWGTDIHKLAIISSTGWTWFLSHPGKSTLAYEVQEAQEGALLMTEILVGSWAKSVTIIPAYSTPPQKYHLWRYLSIPDIEAMGKETWKACDLGYEWLWGRRRKARKNILNKKKTEDSKSRKGQV